MGSNLNGLYIPSKPITLTKLPLRVKAISVSRGEENPVIEPIGDASRSTLTFNGCLFKKSHNTQENMETNWEIDTYLVANLTSNIPLLIAPVLNTCSVCILQFEFFSTKIISRETK